jgi:hypothetical protein
VEDIARETFGFLKRKRIETARKTLLKRGFITEHQNPDPRMRFDRTVHYQLDPVAVNAAIDYMIKSNETRDGEKSHSSGTKIPTSGTKIPTSGIKIPNNNRDEHSETSDRGNGKEPPNLLLAKEGPKAFLPIMDLPPTTPLTPEELETLLPEDIAETISRVISEHAGPGSTRVIKTKALMKAMPLARIMNSILAIPITHPAEFTPLWTIWRNGAEGSSLTPDDLLEHLDFFINDIEEPGFLDNLPEFIDSHKKRAVPWQY